MGQSLNPLRTHDEVPDDVKATITPIDYTPAPPESRPTDHTACDECGEQYGWFCYSTNCDWCGRQLCTRCCPDQYLLKGNPGCKKCTRRAFCLRREEMLADHLEDAGMRLQHPRAAALGLPAATDAVCAVAPKDGNACRTNNATIRA
ncbi:hypothetical protein ABB37_07580 [Leptomonas pyrrhocoris]|uniref:Uncharacterized protein n=1 Tax=Leptomonas pyrrhocoris TaxID=157538 RepID=A0A0M9FVB9_LEPPY|nr:hypothetical protein ABB37_07580 [Leptomonas pyrrhocoris]XP_015655193.1 hypothetical protein ABB37_07580 [Leptomonas pyrrhocoris]KPA76753.1 hypothetical protein ABB37_07580 [Leptomonas pyrrhocoris]KPA76754.1 hypothetical protein ABB37_07580 [Leptomonas pyrrhocoris]|eukprot:XP_015655192.1 hypothetical protein ABB37_07580 [Leptomonas pyrrhocoris]